MDDIHSPFVVLRESRWGTGERARLWKNAVRHVGHAVHVARAPRLPGSVCTSSSFFLDLLDCAIDQEEDHADGSRAFDDDWSVDGVQSRAQGGYSRSGLGKQQMRRTLSEIRDRVRIRYSGVRGKEGGEMGLRGRQMHSLGLRLKVLAFVHGQTASSATEAVALRAELAAVADFAVQLALMLGTVCWVERFAAKTCNTRSLPIVGDYGASWLGALECRHAMRKYRTTTACYCTNYTMKCTWDIYVLEEWRIYSWIKIKKFTCSCLALSQLCVTCTFAASWRRLQKKRKSNLWFSDFLNMCLK